MKTIRNIIVAILIIIGGMCIANAQNYGLKWSEKNNTDYVYTNFSFDVNKAFGVKDNPRTVVDHRGLDFDIEIGARDRHVAVYAFYGQFNAMNYKNYGAGLDYYFQWLRNTKIHLYNPFTGQKSQIINGIDFSLGNYYSVVLMKPSGSVSSYINPRAITTIWISQNVAFTAKLQYQTRVDKKILEGAFGLTLTLDN